MQNLIYSDESVRIYMEKTYWSGSTEGLVRELAFAWKHSCLVEIFNNMIQKDLKLSIWCRSHDKLWGTMSCSLTRFCISETVHLSFSEKMFVKLDLSLHGIYLFTTSFRWGQSQSRSIDENNYIWKSIGVTANAPHPCDSQWSVHVGEGEK